MKGLLLIMVKCRAGRITKGALLVCSWSLSFKGLKAMEIDDSIMLYVYLCVVCSYLCPFSSN